MTGNGGSASPAWRVYRQALYKAIAANLAVPTSALSKYYDTQIRWYTEFKDSGKDCYGLLSLIGVGDMAEVADQFVEEFETQAQAQAAQEGDGARWSVYPCLDDALAHNKDEARQAQYMGATPIPTPKALLNLLR